jgi:polyisoprenoid-binding protein YceI
MKPTAFVLGLISLSSFASAGVLLVDKERSRIQVDAKATAHGFTGTLEDYTATVSGNADSLKPAGFDLNWKFKDLKTGDAKRDAEMIKWLGGGSPEGKFHFVKSWTAADGSLHGMGTLTIHGISKTVSFPFTAAKDSGWVTIDGKVSMDYEDFRLPIVRAMALMTVDPKLVVRFHVVGRAK